MIERVPIVYQSGKHRLSQGYTPANISQQKI